MVRSVCDLGTWGCARGLHQGPRPALLSPPDNCQLPREPKVIGWGAADGSRSESCSSRRDGVGWEVLPPPACRRGPRPMNSATNGRVATSGDPWPEPYGARVERQTGVAAGQTQALDKALLSVPTWSGDGGMAYRVRGGQVRCKWDPIRALASFVKDIPAASTIHETATVIRSIYPVARPTLVAGGISNSAYL